MLTQLIYFEHFFLIKQENKNLMKKYRKSKSRKSSWTYKPWTPWVIWKAKNYSPLSSSSTIKLSKYHDWMMWIKKNYNKIWQENKVLKEEVKLLQRHSKVLCRKMSQQSVLKLLWLSEAVSWLESSNKKWYTLWEKNQNITSSSCLFVKQGKML